LYGASETGRFTTEGPYHRTSILARGLDRSDREG
jgi:hypothetical protein